MKKIIKKSKMSAGKMVAIGAGVAALSAGAYAFFGPNGKKNQKKAKALMAKMEKEVAQKMKAVKSASAPMYHKAVDALATTYSKAYKEYGPEIQVFAKQLKGKWKDVEKKTKPAIKRVKKAVKKITKK